MYDDSSSNGGVGPQLRPDLHYTFIIHNYKITEGPSSPLCGEPCGWEIPKGKDQFLVPLPSVEQCLTYSRNSTRASLTDLKEKNPTFNQCSDLEASKHFSHAHLIYSLRTVILKLGCFSKVLFPRQVPPQRF